MTTVCSSSSRRELRGSARSTQPRIDRVPARERRPLLAGSHKTGTHFTAGHRAQDRCNVSPWPISHPVQLADPFPYMSLCQCPGPTPHSRVVRGWWCPGTADSMCWAEHVAGMDTQNARSFCRIPWQWPERQRVLPRAVGGAECNGTTARSNDSYLTLRRSENLYCISVVSNLL
jgi:hypothetical protein